MSRGELASLIGEGFHTAFRKVGASPEAAKVHRLIDEMDVDEWSDVVEFVVHGVLHGGDGLEVTPD